MALFVFSTCSKNKGESSSSSISQTVSGESQSALNSNGYLEAPTLLATPLAADQLKTTIHRLKNGMTVYISPDPKKPVIQTYIAVRAGSAEDPKDSTGLAHYLQHMLFKGTSKYGTTDIEKEKPHLEAIAALYDDMRQPNADLKAISQKIDAETQKASQYAIPNEFDTLYSRLGIDGVNAFTADDATVYIATVPSHRLEAWSKVESERLSDPQFRLFWTELEAVYEEKNRSLDNPGWRIQEAMNRGLFPDHGYGYSSGIGEIEHLKIPAYKDMTEFFNNWYVPENMAIFLAGDVDAKTAIPLLEREFSKFQKAPQKVSQPGSISPLTQKTEVDVPVPAQEGVIMAWQLVPASHNDRYAIEVMDLLLLDGQSGMLNRDLMLSQKVAQASCNPTFRRYAGHYELSADALKGQTHQELETLLLAEVNKLKTGDFSAEDLKAALVRAKLNEQAIVESNNARVGHMLQAYMTGQPWADYIRRIERLSAITKEDVVRVAQKYLSDNYLLLKKIEKKTKPPQIVKPSITPVKIDPSKQSDFAKSIFALKATPPAPETLIANEDYFVSETTQGDLVTVPNTYNQLFAADWNFEYGRKQDPLVCFALTVLQDSGTTTKSPEAMERELSLLGSSVNFSCGDEGLSISASGLDSNLAASVAFIREWISQADIKEAALKGAVKKVKTSRHQIMNDPRSIGQAAYSYASLAKRSPFLLATPTTILENATPELIKASLNKILTLENKSSYYGPKPIEEVQKNIALSTGETKTKERPPYQLRKSKKTEVFYVDQETAQSQILFGWPKAPSNDVDRAVGTLFSNYVGGGMGGLLFQEIREARGLAYSVAGWYSSSSRKKDETSVGAYMGTQSDKTKDAMTTLLDVLKRPIDDKRLAKVRASMEAARTSDRTSPRSISSVVYAWKYRGVDSDPREKDYQNAMKVSKEELQKWIKSTMKSRAIISVVGPKNSIDLKHLSTLGKLNKVKADSLFNY